MRKVNGFEIRVEVEGLNKFAQCLLHITNIKCSRKGIITDIRTIEGTDYLVITGHEKYKSFITSVVSEYGNVDDSVHINLLIVNDDDVEKLGGKAYKEVVDEWYADEGKDFRIVGDFEEL